MELIRATPLSPVILKADGASASVTGTTSETILKWLNVRAGVMTANSAIELDTILQQTGSAGAMVFTIRIIAGTSNGTTSGATLANSTVGTNVRQRWAGLLANTNNVSAQVLYANASAAFTASTLALGTSAIDTSADFTISFNLAMGSALDTGAIRYLKSTLIPGV